MRFYDIRILEPDTRATIVRYTSQADDGWTNPNALHVDLDIPTYALAEPAGTAYARIYGIGIERIGQAGDLNGKTVQIYGGMAKGLPLANPAQANLLIEAEITQAYGTWQGTLMCLDLVIQTATGSQFDPRNIVLNWLAGQPLAEALRNTLNTAFPGFTVLTGITDTLVQDHDEPGFFQTVIQLAQWVKEKTRNMIGGTYNGVDFTIRDKQIVIYDGTSVTEPLAIRFQDLIGQPTWIGPDQIQFKCPMRGDINVSDYISLPAGQVTTTAQSYSQYRNKSTFTGSYQITHARALGSYRQPDGDAWVSVYDAFPIIKDNANG